MSESFFPLIAILKGLKFKINLKLFTDQQTVANVTWAIYRPDVEKDKSPLLSFSG